VQPAPLRRGVAFTFGCIAMFVLFYRAGEIYSKAFKTYPRAAKPWLVASMVNFYVPWTCFPVLWLYGPEAGGQMGNGRGLYNFNHRFDP
jgi:bacteriorhodopsin